MTLLKGLVASAVGLFCVLIFCGSISGVVQSGIAEFYSINGEFLMDKRLFSTIWLVCFLFLAVFIGIYVLTFSGWEYCPLFVWCALHTLIPVLVFKFSEILLSLVLLFVVIGLYVYFLVRISTKKPKIVLFFLPYLGWLTYLFVILYSISLLN